MVLLIAVKIRHPVGWCQISSSACVDDRGERLVADDDAQLAAVVQAIGRRNLALAQPAQCRGQEIDASRCGEGVVHSRRQGADRHFDELLDDKLRILHLCLLRADDERLLL